MAINKKSNSVSFNKKKKESATASSKPLTSSQALKNYNSVQSRKPASFTYNDTQLKKLYDDAMNRKDFSFDLNGNAFYNQYKDKFTKQGQMAMADTVGQVAAASGGYGNSYAQTAGQQVYQQNLDQLNDIVPDLYNLAFQQYQYEGQQLQDKYNMAQGERDFAYGQHRDNVSDWQYDNDTAYNIYADTRDYEYQQGRDKVADEQWQKTYDRGVYESDRAYNRGVYESDRDFNYQKGRDKVADEQWQKTYDRGVYESDRDFNYQQGRDKVADEQWQKTYNRGVYESDRDFNYQQGRDQVADRQWQQTFDRGVYESDRNYNRGVYESDRDYNRGVYESDRSFNEGQRQFNESLAFDKQQSEKSSAQWDKTYSLSQQELAETIRHNKANEGYNMQSLNVDSSNPFGDDTVTDGDSVTLSSITPTSSYSNLSGKSKMFYDQVMLKGYNKDDVIERVYDAVLQDEISESDAAFLLKKFGVKL